MAATTNIIEFTIIEKLKKFTKENQGDYPKYLLMDWDSRNKLIEEIKEDKKEIQYQLNDIIKDGMYKGMDICISQHKENFVEVI
jgi:hypothetical protein